MESETATPQSNLLAPVRPNEDAQTAELESDPESEPEIGLDWEAQPEQMTTREVATLFGKSPGNIRARASRGDFGNTVTGEDGLPRYDRARVRAVYDRITAREAQGRAVTNLYATASGTQMGMLPQSLSGMLAGLQAQHQEQIALWSSRLADSQQIALQSQVIAQQAQHEAQELRTLLAQREETTRETLSHMDTLYSETITHLRETVFQQQAALAQRSEITVPSTATSLSQPSLWRRLFGG
jgi:hypothetical protein